MSTLALSILITAAVCVACRLLRSAGRGRNRNPYSHSLALRHRRINAQHLRNGGTLAQSLLCLTAGYALALLMWAIAHGVMSITEPRW